MSRVEIDTDVRYMDDPNYGVGLPDDFGQWPKVSNIFERKLATNIRRRSSLTLDPRAFVRVIGLAAQLHDKIITLRVEVRTELVEARIIKMDRNHTVIPPITADDAKALEFAMHWFAVRHLPLRLTVSPENFFWIPID